MENPQGGLEMSKRHRERAWTKKHRWQEEGRIFILITFFMYFGKPKPPDCKVEVFIVTPPFYILNFPPFSFGRGVDVPDHFVVQGTKTSAIFLALEFRM